MDEFEIHALLSDVELDIDHGSVLSVQRKLLPLVRSRNAQAMFLYSSFSINGEETEEEFNKRRIGLLIDASELGYPPAIYELAVCYYYGDGVEEQRHLSSSLFQLAAEKGHGKAKLSHAQNLFYGVNGIAQNKADAMTYVLEAIEERVDGAIDVLNGFEASGNKR